MAECADSTPTKSIEHVCVSPSSKEQICLLCAKVVSNNDFRRKLTTSGGRKKTKKTCFNPSQYWERRFHNQGILDIRTHFKPTKTFQYTHFSSCNPHGVRKGVIKGEALIPLRTNSSSKSFYDNIFNFKKRLCARGYCHNLIEKITCDRSRLLPLRLNLPSGSQLYKRTMKCERKFCLSLPRTTLLCRTLKTF